MVCEEVGGSRLISCVSLVGEYVKNWRPRWFILKNDGTFLGFKSKPPPGGRVEPQNNFKIDRKNGSDVVALLLCFNICPLSSINLSASVGILPNDKLKKNAFVIR